MQIYQPKKRNPYILPDTLYRQMIYTVQGYDRRASNADDVLHESGHDSGPRSGPGDPAAAKAMRVIKAKGHNYAIDKAILAVPTSYRAEVVNHVKCGGRWPDYAHRQTWNFYQSMFLYHVAKNLGEI